MRKAFVPAVVCLASAVAALLPGAIAPSEAQDRAAAESPERLLQRARGLEDTGKASRAAELYRSFLKAHPNHSQVLTARYRLAKCLDALGLVDEAIKQLKTVSRAENKRFRHRRDALYALGKLYGSLKQYEAATKVFEQLLAEGAGLYQDEVLSLCGGYYAVRKKYDEAAAKFNILKRREGSRFAERAAYKLAVLWLRAEKLELAVEAVQDLATRFPRNNHARGLMVQLANLFRKAGRHDRAIALCTQLRSRFPKSQEARMGGYVIGLCHRDRRRFDEAVKAFDALARVPENRKSGLAAEALLQSAEVLYSDLTQPDRAMQRYEEAAKMARDYGGERQGQILERCYFRLAEHHYTHKKYSVALEYYLLLRRTGTKLNVLPRILQCQARIDSDEPVDLSSPSDAEFIRRKIKEHAGTFVAAEAQTYLADRKMAEALRRKGGFAEVIAQYEKILKGYSKEVLATQSLASYLCLQLGVCYGQGKTKADLAKATAWLEKALAVDRQTPYRVAILETLAGVADAAGDKQRAYAVYKQLFEASAARLDKGEDDPALRERTAEYIRCMLTRAEQKDSIEEALAVARRIMDRKGPFSEAARHALFYMAELYFLKKDFSAAARTYGRFIKAYGPKQDANGDVVKPPWRPSKIDDRVEQVYEAAVRIAHCWYMQGHTKNMIRAYQWTVRNFPYRNRHCAEAHYWLALEHGKGKEGRRPENRRKMAEALWKNVVHPSFDFESREFHKGFRFWVSDERAAKYVKSAILKAGQTFSELKEHAKAAGIFGEYLALYPAPGDRGRRRRGRGRDRSDEPKPDPLYSIARYALGREQIALGDIPALVECYSPYVDRMREDRFRVSALRLLGYHAGRAGLHEPAIEAYATLLDEYGQNKKNAKGEPIPVPVKDRIRPGRYRWNGIRRKPPKGLDLGQVRYALGFLYWKKEDWARCVKILRPFIDNPHLFDNPSRPKALYMVAQSYYHVHDYAQGVPIVMKLIRDHRKFEAIEEAHVYAARGCVETAKWSQILRLYEKFTDQWSRSAFRPHMDLYAAVATLEQGKTDRGLARLKAIAESDTYADVKASAYYYVGLHLMSRNNPDYREAARQLAKSIAAHPREGACLAAAQCYVQLREWDKARLLLDRTLRSFPKGDRRKIDQAKKLLPEVLKQMANKP